MAARVTAAEVKEILDNSTLTDPIINAFIAAATLLVDNVLSTDTTLDADLLKEIERWLTAHMITVTPVGDRIVTEAGAGGASVKFAGTYGESLHASPYGQMVLTLDSTGKFAALNSKRARLIAIQSFDS